MIAIVPSRNATALPDDQGVLPGQDRFEDMPLPDALPIPAELQVHLPRLLEALTSLRPDAGKGLRERDALAALHTNTVPMFHMAVEFADARLPALLTPRNDKGLASVLVPPVQATSSFPSAPGLSSVSVQIAQRAALGANVSPDMAAAVAPTSRVPGSVTVDALPVGEAYRARAELPVSQGAGRAPAPLPQASLPASNKRAGSLPRISQHVFPKDPTTTAHDASPSRLSAASAGPSRNDSAGTPTTGRDSGTPVSASGAPSQTIVVAIEQAERGQAPVPARAQTRARTERDAVHVLATVPGDRASVPNPPSSGLHEQPAAPHRGHPVTSPVAEKTDAYLRLPFTHNGLSGTVDVQRQVVDASVQLHLQGSHAEINRHLAQQLEKTGEPAWRVFDDSGRGEDREGRPRQHGEADDDPDNAGRERRR